MVNAVHILGIHDGHNSGATLVTDGKVVASVSEERLSRRKNEVGYPRRSIEDVLRIGGVDPSELSEIAFASLFMHAQNYLLDVGPWYTVGLEDQRRAAEQPAEYQKLVFDQRKRERIADVVDHLGVSEDRVTFTEHHLAHLAAAYYTAPWRQTGQRVLGLTCDGAGDNLCATVSVCCDNEIERISSTGRHASLGKIYSRVTFLMGMTPWEHEYKLMGMAPYADPERSDVAAKPLRELLRISDDGLGFQQAGELSTNYSYVYLREAFERIRFDTVAGATQLFTEEMLVAWVKNCVAHTGIRDIVVGGGVFMNVKANMLIAGLPEVDRLYVMPSGGDESLSIGSALHRYYVSTGLQDHSASVLDDLYLGGEFDLKAEQAATDMAARSGPLEIQRPNDMNDAVAGLLDAGETVALCRGRMEWGARALGNRSIVTSAHDYARVDRINRAIKMRDFWMPFAPSFKEESAHRYFDDPKDLKPWFMTFAYQAKDEGYQDIVAGSHPRDRTIRPQVVRQSANPEYHSMISRWEKKTGRGAVLNTSFNLHGEPIVYSPDDAIRVLLNSGLKHLALNAFLISMKEAA